MELQVFLRSVYGKVLVYPANEAARTVCLMLGTRSLMNRELTYLGLLGHKVVTVADPALVPA